MQHNLLLILIILIAEKNMKMFQVFIFVLDIEMSWLCVCVWKQHMLCKSLETLTTPFWPFMFTKLTTEQISSADVVKLNWDAAESFWTNDLFFVSNCLQGQRWKCFMLRRLWYCIIMIKFSLCFSYVVYTEIMFIHVFYFVSCLNCILFN